MKRVLTRACRPRIGFLTAFVCALATLPQGHDAWAQAARPSRPPPAPREHQPTAYGLVYHVAAMDKATVRKDIVYKSVGGSSTTASYGQRSVERHQCARSAPFFRLPG